MAEEELEGWGATDAPDDGHASEAELDTRKLIVERRKKRNRKSGGFQCMGLSGPVLRGILRKGYKLPTPIQRKTIPVILEGKDVVAMARTGSGKTASFLVPLFEKLQSHSSRTGIRALIIAPTRELALQTLKFTKELGKFTGLRAAVVLGGDSMEGQFAALHENPDIVIATPGRLVHVSYEMNLKFQNVQFVVFDEADQLFELGFAEQLDDILKRLPEVRQMVLFSATLPKMLVEFAKAGLFEPVLIRLDTEHILSENLQLAFFKCNSDDKLGLLIHLMQRVIDSNQQTVIFAATKHHVEYLHLALDKANIPNTLCYSSLDPTARKINVAMFRSRQVRCMLVTDVAARGIDIPLLDNVINYNFPGKPKLFVHRVGRVARAGRSGVAYSFIAPDEAAFLLDLHLFLTKELRIAPHPPDESKKDDWNYMYGSVPQAILDNEIETVATMHSTSYDLEMAKKSCDNAYKQYSKSRPLPSTESVKRMKENEHVVSIGYHPLLMDFSPGLEQERIEMLKSLKNLQPKGTVFEMIKTKKGNHTLGFEAMKAKRSIDDHRIDKFYKSLAARQMARKEKDDQAQQTAQQVGKMEMSSERDVKSVFSAILGKDQDYLGGSNEKSKKKEKDNKNFKDMEYYIPYTRDNEVAESGYSVGSNFLQSSEANTLEIGGTDDLIHPKKTSLHKWDRTKKRYVGTQSQKKMIKTESGAWISASYNTKLYQKWLKRDKSKDMEGNSDEEDAGETNQRFRAIKNHGKVHPLLKERKHLLKQPLKRELKTDAEIRKEEKRVKLVKMNEAISRARKQLGVKRVRTRNGTSKLKKVQKNK